MTKESAAFKLRAIDYSEPIESVSEAHTFFLTVQNLINNSAGTKQAVAEKLDILSALLTMRQDEANLLLIKAGEKPIHLKYAHPKTAERYSLAQVIPILSSKEERSTERRKSTCKRASSCANNSDIKGKDADRRIENNCFYGVR